MWIIISTAIIILFSFAPRPNSVSPVSKIQNNSISEIEQAAIVAKYSEPNQSMPEIKEAKKRNQNKETFELTTTPSPTKFVTPTIHIEQPPDGFSTKPTITITPTPIQYYDSEELPIDPLPTRNPCYCDPYKEMLCLDVYKC